MVNNLADYNAPLTIKWNDALVEITQNITSINNEAAVQQIPDSYQRVQLTDSSGTAMSEVQEGETIGSNQFYVDYTTGFVRFSKDTPDGSVFTAHFFGRGIILYPANRVISNSNNPDVYQNLQEIIDNGQSAINAANVVADLEYKGDYSSSISYKKNNLVLYQGTTYICIQDSVGNNAPTNTAYWSVFAQAGDMQKSIYDTDNNGQVDKADDSDKLGGQLPSYYGKQNEIGVLSNLSTTDKSNLVAATNEVDGDLKTHKADYANPHKVTAGQVGLGSGDTASFGTIELMGADGNPFSIIDYHAGTDNDYDVRLWTTDGVEGSNGQGKLNIIAKIFTLNADNVLTDKNVQSGEAHLTYYSTSDLVANVTFPKRFENVPNVTCQLSYRGGAINKVDVIYTQNITVNGFQVRTRNVNGTWDTSETADIQWIASDS